MNHKLDRKTVRLANRITGGSKTAAEVAASFLCLLYAACLLNSLAWDARAATQLDSENLFNRTHILNVHLKFSPEQWAAMEPKGGPGGGPGAPGGPGRGPGGPGGPGGFGPGMFLAPLFLREGDANHDNQFSQAEFIALGRKWFEAWDTNHSGKLDAAKIRAGLDKTMSGPGGPGGPGPGGPGGPGGGRGLQGPEGKRNGLASMMGIEFEYVHADLELEGRDFKDVAVRYKGNGTFLESRGSLKRSLKIELGKYSQGNKLVGISKINLQNNVTDASWMNEVLAYRLYRDAGVPTPRTTYARVHLTVTGKYDHQYLGLYSLSEEVDKHFAERNFGSKRGAIFKPVTPALFTDLGTDWDKYNQTYDPKTLAGNEQTDRVMEFARFCDHAQDGEFAAKLTQYLDLDEFARYMAVTVWLSDLDGLLGPGQNFYLHLHPATQLFAFIPWDQDHSFGQMRGTQEERENLSLDHPWQGENRFLSRVFKVPAFQKLYHNYLGEFSKTLFQAERLASQVDDLAKVIRPAVEAESKEKLERFDQVVAGESVRGGGFGNFGGDGPKPIKTFTPARTHSVIEQVSGRSTGMVQGNSGFPGGGRGPGGPGRRGGGPGGPGGPAGFGPGMFVGGLFVEAFDHDHDSVITREEVDQTFTKWFKDWSGSPDKLLSEEKLRAGIDKDLSPFRNGPPGFGGFPGPQGPPDDQ